MSEESGDVVLLSGLIWNFFDEGLPLILCSFGTEHVASPGSPHSLENAESQI